MVFCLIIPYSAWQMFLPLRVSLLSSVSYLFILVFTMVIFLIKQIIIGPSVGGDCGTVGRVLFCRKSRVGGLLSGVSWFLCPWTRHWTLNQGQPLIKYQVLLCILVVSQDSTERVRPGFMWRMPPIPALCLVFCKPSIKSCFFHSD